MAKNITQLITTVRANQLAGSRLRYKTGTTTGAGNAGGTTFVDSGLSTYADDFFNGCWARLTSGSFSKLKEVLVTDFVSSTGTVTVAETLGNQVATSTSYEIFEKNVWSDPHILEWLNGELASIAHLLDERVAPQLIKRSTVSGVSGVLQIPSDMVRLVSLRLTDGSGTVHLLHPSQRYRFDDDDVGSNSYRLVIPAGSSSVDANQFYGRFEYKPTGNTSFDFDYIPKLADVSSSQVLQAPDWLADILVAGATYRGFVASDDFTKAQAYKTQRDELITLANRQQLSKAA